MITFGERTSIQQPLFRKTPKETNVRQQGRPSIMTKETTISATTSPMDNNKHNHKRFEHCNQQMAQWLWKPGSTPDPTIELASCPHYDRKCGKSRGWRIVFPWTWNISLLDADTSNSLVFIVVMILANIKIVMGKLHKAGSSQQNS